MCLKSSLKYLTCFSDPATDTTFLSPKLVRIISIKTSIIKKLKMGQTHFTNFSIRNIQASSVYIPTVQNIFSAWLSALLLFSYVFLFLLSHFSPQNSHSSNIHTNTHITNHTWVNIPRTQSTHLLNRC